MFIVSLSIGFASVLNPPIERGPYWPPRENPRKYCIISTVKTLKNSKK